MEKAVEKRLFLCTFAEIIHIMKRVILLICALLLASAIFAQDFDLPCGNINYKPEVQTVLLYADGNQLNDPVIPLEDMTERLTLMFDILDGDGEVLNYTFIHCNHEWIPTDIQRIQYASGFESDRIDDFAFSRNTLVEYVNYQLVFPKEDMMPLISGNYLLIVYHDDLTEDNILFTRRFMVVDEKAHVGASVPRYPDDLSLTDTHQQLNVKVNMNNYISGNTQQFSFLNIRQNGRWDNAAEGLKPTYVYPDYISFDTDYWRREINLQLKLGLKSEQQAFAARGLDYVTNEYLPARLSELGVL